MLVEIVISSPRQQLGQSRTDPSGSKEQPEPPARLCSRFGNRQLILINYVRGPLYLCVSLIRFHIHRQLSGRFSQGDGAENWPIIHHGDGKFGSGEIGVIFLNSSTKL